MGRSKPIRKWIRKNKIKSLCIVVTLYVLLEVSTIPFWSIASLNRENPLGTALMNQRQQEANDKGQSLKIIQHWVPLSKIPKHARNAILVAEDGTFYSHGGVDWHEVWESAKTNMENGRVVRGASTITQQVAKNLYLSTAKTPMRKFKEVIIAFMLEEQLNKRRILEIYMNIIEWGNGIFGIEAASQIYFKTSASRLTRDQAVRLAAVIPSPLRYRPDENSQYVLKKKKKLMQRLSLRERNQRR